MSDNLKIWNELKTPPPEALKPIKGGRLKGFTDISPQWRYKALTEQFGPCGIGWKYEITKMWIESGDNDQRVAFATISFYYKNGEGWSEAIPGIGGSFLTENETKGPYTSDEAYKMAVTDALGVAVKMIGVGSDVYMGNMDGSKSRSAEKSPKCPNCGKDENVIMGKKEYGGGWLCWKKNGGCGHKWQNTEKETTAVPLPPTFPKEQQKAMDEWKATGKKEIAKGRKKGDWWQENKASVVKSCTEKGAKLVYDAVMK